jgi:hypothetical protein
VQVDDVWGKIGTSSFDVQIGRFEAWNLQDESNDMLILEAPNGTARYEANYARGRIDSAGQLAVHAFAGEVFGFEGAFVYGKDGTDNLFGVRPVINTRFGNIEFAAGGDYLNTTPQDDSELSETKKSDTAQESRLSWAWLRWGSITPTEPWKKLIPQASTSLMRQPTLLEGTVIWR